MEIPKRKFFYLNDNVKYSYNMTAKLIILYLDNAPIDSSILNLILQNKDCEFKIYFTGSVKAFNELLTNLTNNTTPKSVTIYPNINIKRNTFLAIDNLPNRVKINFTSSTNNNQDSLIEWVLNLSDMDFSIVEPHIADENNKKHLKQEREIAKTVFKHLSKRVDFSCMSDTEKMNFMYKWLRENISYDISLVNSSGFKDDVDQSLGSDPVKVFFRQKGVCSGRSRLLKILTNNPYMNLNCFTVTGTIRYGQVKKHEWNAFIDENNQVYYYDTSFSGIEHIKDLNKTDKEYKIETQSFLVLDTLNKACPPPLPRRRIPPLPPRRKESPLSSKKNQE